MFEWINKQEKTKKETFLMYKCAHYHVYESKKKQGEEILLFVYQKTIVFSCGVYM